jgi:phosphoglycerol transferase
VVLSLAGAAVVQCLWRADLGVPLRYWGDGMFTSVMVKTILEGGWFLESPRLGLPGTYQLYDFPMADNLHFLLIKLLALPGLDYAAAGNLYYLLTFPLTAVSALFVLRRFGVTAAPALVAALLFAFLPYHFFRGTSHLFLAAYYLVPPAVLVALWVYQGPCPLFGPPDEASRPRLRLFDRRSPAAVLICLLVSSAGVYYAFFACFLLLAAGLAAALDRRRLYPLVAAGLLAGVITAGSVANIAPCLLYTARHGDNPATHHLDLADQDRFGLRLAELLLPLSDHRSSDFAHLKRKYDRAHVLTESMMATLGVAGAVGFVLLLLRLFSRRPAGPPDAVADGLAVLNGAAVLLALAGGLGSLVALVLTPSIRGYNRISVYVGFLALFALALALDRLGRRLSGSARGRWAFAGLCAGLLVLGVLDQTTTRFEFVGRYAEAEREYRHDAEFVGRIEKMLPPGSMVFQLPCVPFPESRPVCGMRDYDHFRGYLHSRTLRWSYGAIKGRLWGEWQARVGARPVERVVPAVVAAGFTGLWVDRFGYPDSGAKAEAALVRLLGARPLRSGNGRWLFFDLRPYAHNHRPAAGATETPALQYQ